MSQHPWSKDVEAQAAIRRAEVDRGPTLAHHEVPGAVERLAERVARLEAVIPKSVSVSNAETPENKGDNMRTERVTLEVTHCSLYSASGWSWGDGLRCGYPLAEVQSVRVVPTPGPGPGLTDESREFRSILARDAAAREGGDEVARLTAAEQSAAWDGARDACRGAIQRLTAERDAAEVLCRKLSSELTRVRTERDAAIRERDEIKAFWLGELRQRTSERDAALARACEAERAYEAECSAKAQAAEDRDVSIQEQTGDAAESVVRAYEVIGPATPYIVHTNNKHIAERNARECGGRVVPLVRADDVVRDAELLAALARVKELEAAGEPVAWAVADNRGNFTHWPKIWADRPQTKQEAEAACKGRSDRTVVPLYATPQQERVVRLPRLREINGTSFNLIGIRWWNDCVGKCRDALDAAGVRWEVGE